MRSLSFLLVLSYMCVFLVQSKGSKKPHKNPTGNGQKVCNPENADWKDLVMYKCSGTDVDGTPVTLEFDTPGTVGCYVQAVLDTKLYKKPVATCDMFQVTMYRRDNPKAPTTGVEAKELVSGAVYAARESCGVNFEGTSLPASLSTFEPSEGAEWIFVLGQVIPRLGNVCEGYSQVTGKSVILKSKK